jgi:hypothetical protein
MQARSAVRRTAREHKRQYKREYMRAWRADPRNHTREQLNRSRSVWSRKLRLAKRRLRPYTNLHDAAVCGFCGQRPPVERVTRLKILSNGQYERVTVPYCGQC